MSLDQSYPAVLLHEVRRAARLTHTIVRLGHQVRPGDPTFLWMLGRADEVRAVVSEVTREWSLGHVGADGAAVRLREYMRELTSSLSSLQAMPQGPARLGAHRPAADTLAGV